MLGGTPDPRFHPRKAVTLTTATLAVLALAVPATTAAATGHHHLNHHRTHQAPSLIHEDPLSGYGKTTT